jgi:integrase
MMGEMRNGFVRVSAVVRMRVRDFQNDGGNAWLVLHEKGGKQRRLPAHHRVREYVSTYLDRANIDALMHARAPLFQSAPRTAKHLSGSALDRSAVLAIVKRRCRAAGLPSAICNHSFRATGITLYQENGGNIDAAAYLAGHSDPRTTQLYNRAQRQPRHADVERVFL